MIFGSSFLAVYHLQGKYLGFAQIDHNPIIPTPKQKAFPHFQGAVFPSPIWLM